MSATELEKQGVRLKVVNNSVWPESSRWAVRQEAEDRLETIEQQAQKKCIRGADCCLRLSLESVETDLEAGNTTGTITVECVSCRNPELIGEIAMNYVAGPGETAIQSPIDV